MSDKIPPKDDFATQPIEIPRYESRETDVKGRLNSGKNRVYNAHEM